MSNSLASEAMRLPELPTTVNQVLDTTNPGLWQQAWNGLGDLWSNFSETASGDVEALEGAAQTYVSEGGPPIP